MAECRNQCSSDLNSRSHFELDSWQKHKYRSYSEDQKKAAGHSALKTVLHGQSQSECTKVSCSSEGQTTGPFQRRNRTSLAARKLNMKPDKNHPRESNMVSVINGFRDDREFPNFNEEKNGQAAAPDLYRAVLALEDNTCERNACNSFASSSEKSCDCGSTSSRRAKSCDALPVWSREGDREISPSPRRAISETVSRPRAKAIMENGRRGGVNVFVNGRTRGDGSTFIDDDSLLNLLEEKENVIIELESELQRILLEKQDVLTGLSPANHKNESDGFAQLSKDFEINKRQLSKLEEDNKTLALKLELEEDLRRNDKECIDMLRKQIYEIEDKLQASDRRVREQEHEKRRLQSMCKCSFGQAPPQAQAKVPDLLKLKYKLELNQATINAIENEYAKLKESKIKLEETHQSDQEILIELRHQLANTQADNQKKGERIGQLEEERQCLEDYQRKCRSLQRRDQKSSYALQLQIVDLQEKLEACEKNREESQHERNAERQKIEKLEENMKKLEGKYRTKLEEALSRVKSLKAQALKDNVLSTEKFTEELNLWKAKSRELEDLNLSLRNELELQRKSNCVASSLKLVQGPLDSAFTLLEELCKSRGKLIGINTTDLVDSLQEFIKEAFIPEGSSMVVNVDGQDRIRTNPLSLSTKKDAALMQNKANVSLTTN